MLGARCSGHPCWPGTALPLSIVDVQASEERRTAGTQPALPSSYDSLALVGSAHYVRRVSVVRREARRRWLAVAALVAGLCLLPAVIAAVPVGAVPTDPTDLRDRIMASAGQPYSGDLDTHGQIALPDVPALSSVGDLFKTMRLRAWYARPDSWRVAVLQVTGERDIYHDGSDTYVWDYGHNLTTIAIGDAPVRLPNPGDLLPPDLARRLLTDEPNVTAIQARRIAGISAAGLRVTPSRDDTTIDRVDIWADPGTGLPLQVEVYAKTGGDAVFTSRFLSVDQRAPASDVLAPRLPPGSGVNSTTAEDVTSTINDIAPVPLPSTLAGRPRLGGPAAARVVGLAGYGIGLSSFVVFALPGRAGADAVNAARDRGALPVTLPNADAYQTSTTLVNGLILRTLGERPNRRTYLIAGPVTPDVLKQAAAELIAGSRR